MAGQIPRHFIDDLLSRVDIVDVIEHRVKLKKSGSNHSACCPFHAEKTPSFTVSQTKQFYHCFGCGAHGSAIGFLMEYDGMHFVDAIETLAESVGLEVPREAGGASAADRQRSKSLFDLMEECATFFQNNLRKHPAAITYLQQRGLDGETAKRFGIGYSPEGWDTLIKAFPSQESALLETGMLTRNDKGRVYDRFRDRIMFPIRDRRGRVIAFGGRILDTGEPKYLNSPETSLYHKGLELYGLYEGRKAAQEEGRVVVVEGYMDVIALAHHGVNNAVATLGTATNQQHCETIYRVVPDIVFCFDGDRAGVDAAWRALNATLPCLSDGRDAHFLFLPDGEDPDSLVTKLGADGFNDRLAEKKPIIDFLFEHLAGDADLSEIGTRARLAETAKPLMNKIPEGIYRQLAQKRLEALIGMSLAATQQPTRHKLTKTSRSTQHTIALTPMRRAILLIVQNPWLVATLEPEKYDFDADMPGAALLMKLIAICDGSPDITSGALIEHFRGTENEAPIDKLSTSPYLPDNRDMDNDIASVEFANVIDTLNRQSGPREASKVPFSSRTGLLSLNRKREKDD